MLAEATFKGTLKERFSRAPFIQYNRGDNWGLVGFDKTLTEEDIAHVKQNLKTLSSNEVTWSVPEGKVWCFFPFIGGLTDQS